MKKLYRGSGNAKKTVPILDGLNFDLTENTDLLTQVVGFDPDHKDRLSYSFADSSLSYTAPDGVVFSIDESTGEITSTGSVDYETTQSYELDLKVTDRAGKRHRLMVPVL